MGLAYVLDELFENHVAPGPHPERPERLRCVRERLAATSLESEGTRLGLRDVRDAELGLVHEPDYLGELERHMPGRSGWLDEDTFFSTGSWEAARKAAAATVDAALAVLTGRASRGLAVVRPPGHHACAGKPMGFCIYNNAAVAAAAAREAGAARVAVLDFDVHHGNGTEEIFYADPDVLYLSVHQSPLYPGTGAAADIGAGAGAGATVNVGLPPGSGDPEYAAVFDRVFGPALDAFAAELLIVSAGFDAAVADPLAQMEVSAAGYRAIADRLVAIADRSSEGRLVAVLEGGYDLDGLSTGVEALVEAMLGRPPAPALEPTEIAAGAEAAIAATLSAHPGLAGKSR